MHPHPQQQEGRQRVAGHLAADADLLAVEPRPGQDLEQRAQHRRVIFVVELGHVRIVAIDGQQILREIVRPHRQEIDPARQGLGLIDGRRHLDHDADRRHPHLIAFLQQLVVRTLDQEQGIVDLADGADHGQQQLQVVESNGRAQHRAHLAQEDLGMVERDADATPAQEGIGLLHRKVRQRLVAADVEGADRHRTWREQFQYMPIVGHLRRLARKAVAHDEGQLSPVETDAGRFLDAERTALGHQTGVEIERDHIAVGGLGRQMAQGLQLAGQGRVIVGQTLVLRTHGRPRRDIDTSAIAVDHHLAPLDPSHRQIRYTHGRRDAHPTRQDSHMGRPGTRGRDDAGQLLARHVGDLHGADLIAHQNRARWILNRRTGPVLQVHQDAAPQIAHIRGPFAQIGIVHGVEHPCMFGDGLAQRAGRPVAGANPRQGAIDQGVALQHQPPGIEQGHVLDAQMDLRAAGEAVEILGDLTHGTAELLGLGLQILRAAIGHGIQVGGRIDHNRLPETDARRGGQPRQEALRDAVVLQARQLAAGAGKGDGPGQLRGQGHHEGHFVLAEMTPPALTQHQDTEHLTVLDDGRAEKAVITLLAGVDDAFVARMIGRVVEVDRLGTLAHQPDQPASEFEPHTPHGILAQPLCGMQDVTMVVVVVEID